MQKKALRPFGSRKSLGDMFRTVVPLVPSAGEVTGKVTAPVTKLLGLLLDKGEMGNTEILAALSLKSRRRIRRNYVTPTLRPGLIEYTTPDKPNSRLQKYRLTEKGSKTLRKTAGVMQ